MDIQKFERKTFEVNAVQVTDDNLSRVAEWSGGTLEKDPGSGGKSYIRIDVQYPRNERQTKAYAGDWVLEMKRGFKVYLDPAFKEHFDPILESVLDSNERAYNHEINSSIPSIPTEIAVDHSLDAPRIDSSVDVGADIPRQEIDIPPLVNEDPLQELFVTNEPADNSKPE